MSFTVRLAFFRICRLLKYPLNTPWWKICTSYLWGSRWLTVYSLSFPQSPSPVPAKRSKFDELPSPSADKDRKPDWLQSLSNSAHKVCVCACCQCETGFAVKSQKGVKTIVLLNHHIITYDLSSFSLVKWRGAFEFVRCGWFNILVVFYCEFSQVYCFVCCSRIWKKSNWNRGPLLSAPGLLKQQKKRIQLLRMRWRGESSDESCDSFGIKETIFVKLSIITNELL